VKQKHRKSIEFIILYSLFNLVKGEDNLDIAAQKQTDVRIKQAANAPKNPTSWIIAIASIVLIGGALFLYSRVSW
jgi:hypothetical protein